MVGNVIKGGSFREGRTANQGGVFYMQGGGTLGGGREKRGAPPPPKRATVPRTKIEKRLKKLGGAPHKKY